MSEKLYHVEVWPDEKEKLVFHLFEGLEKYKVNLTINQVKNLDVDSEPNQTIVSLAKFFKGAAELKKTIKEKEQRISELEEELKESRENSYKFIYTSQVTLSKDHIKKLNDEMKIYLDIEKNLLYSHSIKQTKYSNELVELMKRFKEESNIHLRFNDAKGDMSSYHYPVFKDGVGLFELIRNELCELDKAMKDKKYIPSLSGIVLYNKLSGREVNCIQDSFYIEPEEYKLPYSDGGYFRPTNKKGRR